MLYLQSAWRKPANKRFYNIAFIGNLKKLRFLEVPMNDFGGIRIENGRPVLYTGLSTRDFAQTKLLQHLTECGYTVTPQKNADIPFTFLPWRFIETSEAEDGTTLLFGEPFSGVSLNALYEKVEKNPTERERQKLWQTLTALFCAVECARKQNIFLRWAGISAIFIADDGSLLFIPPTVTIASLQHCSDEEYSMRCGCYTNPLLPLDALFSFTAATLVYRFITGTVPYSQKNSENRCTDYFDAAYIPLELYTTESKLTQSVNAALGKKKEPEEKRYLLAELISAMTEQVPLAEKTTELEKKRTEFALKQAKQTSKKRFFRKNRTIITVCSVCLIVLVAGIFSFTKNQADKENSAGLSAIQTVEMFYSAYNHLNIDNMSACLTRGAGKDFVNFVTNIYVTLKVRQAYEGLTDALTPDEWLKLPQDRREKRIVFGILHFFLDGKPANAHAVFDTERDKKTQIGIKGETAHFTATYFLFMTQGENSVIVFKRTDELSLEYVKNRWLITDIHSESVQAEDTEQFFIAP